jgi:hypothetical protein
MIAFINMKVVTISGHCLKATKEAAIFATEAMQKTITKARKLLQMLRLREPKSGSKKSSILS